MRTFLLHRWLAPTSAGEPDPTLNVTITVPTASQEFTTTTPTIEWTISDGRQVSRAIVILEDGVIIHNPGFAPSTVQAYTVPAGVLANTGTYVVRVFVVNGDGVTGLSDDVEFTVDATTSGGGGGGGAGGGTAVITNVRARAIGSCVIADVFPLIRLSWDQAVPGGGQTFVRYEVHRRLVGETAWVRIADIEAVDTLRYDDATADSGQVYEYSIVWVATEANGDTLISDETAAVRARIDFDHLWLHALDDSTRRVRFDSWDAQEDIKQDQTFIRSWGRQAPSAFIGSQQSATIRVSGHQKLLNRKADWDQLVAMMTAQREDQTVLCARFGRARTHIFCVISDLSRRHHQHTQEPAIVLTEVFHEEAVEEC